MDAASAPPAHITRPPSFSPRPAAPGTHCSGLIQNQLLDRADNGGGGHRHGPSKWEPPRRGTRPQSRLRQPPDRPRRRRRKTPRSLDTRSSQEKHLLGTQTKDKHVDDWLLLRCFRILTLRLQASPAPGLEGRGWRIYHREVGWRGSQYPGAAERGSERRHFWCGQETKWAGKVVKVVESIVYLALLFAKKARFGTGLLLLKSFSDLQTDPFPSWSVFSLCTSASISLETCFVVVFH